MQRKGKMAGPKKSDEKKEDGEEKKPSENLMVVVRIRPLKSEEKMKGWYRITQAIDKKMVMLQEPETGKNDHLRQKRVKDKQYVYDRLFSDESAQKEVYEETAKALVNDVLNGFNATVFAYGATGAGKTHTMVGSAEQPGIMVRALNDLFHALENTHAHANMQISMSYLEIYNENIRDLLQPSGTLELREDAKTGVIQVAGLKEVSTLNTKEVMRLLTKGNKERTCEPTAANKTSSRSHALLQVNVRQSEKKGNHEEVKNARLFMVDLAGSERAKQTQNKGKRLQEGAHINRSLLALGNCINALAEGRAKYVNYRDSKLTRLLKDALSGNCRTVMIAHVSPCHVHREETRNTLIYADRAKNISKQVRRNVLDVSYHVSQYQNIISELKEEIDRLKGKLEGGREESAGSGAAPLSQEAKEEQQKNAERLKKIKNDLLDLFREQMSLRNKLMEIDNNILALSMEFERQNMVVTEWESERARRLKGRQEPTKGPNGEEIIDMDTDKEKDEDSDDDEPEEVTQAWEDLMYLQKEQQRYTEMREKVEQEMNEVKKRAKEMEEALPETITTDEQRELISLLCKVHELEIQKVEMQSEALLKEHELRRRDLLIMRYDRQRNLCDEIITRQRQVIEAMNDGNSELSTGMPPELQELYALYQMEAQYANSERDIKYLNDANNLLRCPSTLSLRATSFEKLPPIFNNNNKEPEKLFDRPARRHSLGDVRRPESVLSLRSPTRRRGSRASGPSSDRLGSSDALDELTDPDSPGGLRLLRRRSNVPSDDSISLLSLRLDSPPRKARSRQKPLSRRGSLALLQPAQLRRRRGGSASSSEGDSPSRASNKHHRRDLAAPPLRRRGNSLTRLNAGANGNARRRSIPARKGGRKSPDMFNQVGFALHY